VKDFEENVVGNSPKTEAANGNEQNGESDAEQQTALGTTDVATGQGADLG
jgi:hypothetical protein